MRDTSPTLLEAKLRIPAGRKMKLTMDLDKRFLRYTEHPPDAQRGWDLPGAVFTPLPFNTSSSAPDSVGSAGIRQAIGVPERGERTYIHTRTLLLDLATPDFSMPYNVIIMTCTLVALMFGSVFNMLIREFIVVDMTEGAGEMAGAESEKGDVKTSE
jgi:GPI-anchor transamidase subunit T